MFHDGLLRSLRSAILGLATTWSLLSAQAASGQQPVLPAWATSKAGFPMTLAGGGASHSSPVIADLGLTPGHKSIVFGTLTGRLYVVLWNGTVAPGFPVTLPRDIASSPAVGDLDGDGIPEIVVGYGSVYDTAPIDGGVRAYRRNGTLLWERKMKDPGQPPTGRSERVMATPAIADVDADGSNEVAWASFDQWIYLVKGSDGTDKTGWPIFVCDTVYSSPALADLDYPPDGKLEVIVGIDAHLIGAPCFTPDGGCLVAFHSDATPVPGFKVCVDQVIISSPAVGDIDGDGHLEIVVGTGIFYSGDSHRLYAFHDDGTPVAGWPLATDGRVTTSPALADVDGDGILDVVATDDNTPPSTTYHVYAIKGNGALLWKRQPKDFGGSTVSAGNPVLADIQGDSRPEVVLPTNSELCVFSAAGTQLTDNGAHAAGSYSFYTECGLPGNQAAAIGHLECDGGKLEMVVVSSTPFPSATDTKVFVFELKVAGEPSWGMFREGARRVGTSPGFPACCNGVSKYHAVQPCRVLDTRNANGAWGGPAIPAGGFRAFTIAGRCSIPRSATAVSGNLTVANPPTAGSLVLYPGPGMSPPITTAVTYGGGRVRANNFIMILGDGQLAIRSSQSVGASDVIVDVNGYFE